MRNLISGMGTMLASGAAFQWAKEQRLPSGLVIAAWIEYRYVPASRQERRGEPEGKSETVFEKVWVLSDGKIGDLIICRGVASALCNGPEERLVRPGPPWEWFMPWGPLPPRDGPQGENSPIRGALPQVAIASGRRTLAYLRAIKRAGGDKVLTVYLKDPRGRADYVDLIWAPAHDEVQGDNVVVTLTSPHRYSPAVLSSEFGSTPDFLAGLPRPLLSVLLGGDSKDFRFTEGDCNRLVGRLGDLAASGFGLAITPSRRTPEKLVAGIRERLEGLPHYWWAGNGDNPYGYLLAHADYTLTTADSTNMVMEACVTGRPVYYFMPSGGSRKIETMLQSLRDHGAIRPLPETGSELESWHYEPLFSTDVIAAAIRKAALKRGLLAA